MILRHKIRVVGYKRKGRGSERVALFLRLSMYRHQQDIALGIVVDAACFDVLTGRVCNHKDEVFFNRVIDEGKAALEEVLRHYEVNEKRMPTAGEVKETYDKVFNGIERNAPTKSLAQVVAEFQKAEGGKRSWTVATYEKFGALLNNIQEFDKRCTLDKITDQWLYDFVQYYIRKGYTNPTIAKKLGFLRWFLRWCENNGYYKGNAHRTFSVKLKGQNFEQKTIVFLERHELAALESYDFSKIPHLDRARDLFVFSCYSGLRYSDIARLEKSNISDTQISLVTQKTDDALHIDLNQHLRRILSKYESVAGHKALPVISNQKANEYIREACKVAGIDTPVRLVRYNGSRKIEETKPKWQCISFHAGRRTFITMALLLEIPIPVIMQWSGHHDTKMLKPYMAVVDELRKREMAKFDGL